MSDTESENQEISCYYHNFYSTNGGECNKCPTKEQVAEFHALLDKADENNSNEFDSDLEIPSVETYVDEEFYVCPNHQYLIMCDECDEMLTRRQIQNFINSSDYNHLNEGLCVGPAGCTSCWIRYDRELQCELGVDSDGEYKVESEDEQEIPTYPPLPPSPQEEKITLDDLEKNIHKITQKRIQDENVKYGLARCKRESKAKSIKKLRDFLTANPNAKYLEEKTESPPVFINCWIGGENNDHWGKTYRYPLPKGKTRDDFVKLVMDFFEI